MKRKINSCLLAVLLLLQVLCGVPVHAAVAVVSGESLTAAAGTTFEYRVSIQGNPGLAGIGLKLIFDTETFSLVYSGSKVDCARGDFTTSGALYCGPTANGCSIVWTHTSDVTTDGTLFVLKLKVKEGAVSGTYPIRVQNVAQNTINKAEEQIPLTCVDGSVTVRPYQPLIYGESVSVAQGRTVDYSVFLQDNPGIASCGVVVQFDQNSLEAVPLGENGEYAVKVPGGIAQGNVVGKVYTNAVEVFWSSASESTEEGVLFRMRFKAKDSAAPGEYKITVTCIGENTLNEDEELVAFETRNGTLTIRAASAAFVSGAFDASGKLVATVTAPAGAKLIAACYDASGRLVSTRSVTISEACTDRALDTGLTKKPGYTYRLMLVNASTLAPLCPAWSGRA